MYIFCASVTMVFSNLISFQLTARDKKDMKRMEKNKRKEERHRAKVLGEKNIPPPDYSDDDEDAVITSKMGMLQI